MEKLNIISDENKIILNKQDCINVELKFNVSKYGKQWSYIGDRLYYFAHPRNDEDRNPREEIDVHAGIVCLRNV